MDAYREEYEKYEPELRIWPYVLLGFIVPLVPFGCNIILFKEGYLAEYNFLYELLNYVIISSSYFITANVIRTSKGSWALSLNGCFYFVTQLVFWTFYKIKGVEPYPLHLPFLVAIVPAFIFLLSYAFFAKRSRLAAWGTSTLLSMVSALSMFAYFFLSKSTEIERTFYLVYISLLFALSLFTFFVTKRSEAAPWYINIVLILFVFASITVTPGFSSSLVSGHDAILFIFKTLGTSYLMWLMISFCFFYAGLGMKSCFKTLNKEEDLDELVTRVNNSVMPDERPNYDNSSRQYSFPPATNRFVDEEEEEKPVKKPSVEEDFLDDRDRRRPSDNYRQRDRRERYCPEDDDYYDDYRPSRERDYYPRNRRDDYYDDRSYREEERYRRQRDYYDDRPSRYEDERYSRPRQERLDKRDDYYLPRDDRRRRHSSEDKWYDLLRGGLDDSYDSRDDRDR